MYKYLFQDCTAYELEQGYSGYELEVYADTLELAKIEAVKIAREGSEVSLIESNEPAPTKKMNVLVACEESQEVCKAFRAKGHNAYSNDIVDCSGGHPEWHIKGDALKAINPNGRRLDLQSGGLLFNPQWDLIIAHPPCTYLCSSGLHWNGRVEGRAEKTEEALIFVKEIMKSNATMIAIENPTGCISTRIDATKFGFSSKKASQYIQPYDFGHDASKKTGLWLKGLERLEPTKYVEPRLVCCGVTLADNAGKYGRANCCGDNKPLKRWGNQTNSGQNKLGPSEERAAIRAKTYSGWAEAMAEQWG